MQSNKDKWKFIRKGSRPPISDSEVAYWRRTFYQILKVGLELEYNLKKESGSCRGDRPVCGCVHLETRECWKKCANESRCFAGKNTDRFLACLAKTDTCEETDCAACTVFIGKQECPGLMCSSFVGYCIVCKDYTRDCLSCADRHDPSKSPEKRRDIIEKTLSPSGCYGKISGSGVHSVTTDGSLLGGKGVEVITIGRRVDYWEFYQMISKIIKVIVDNGGYLNERCSVHMHVLASYFGKMFANGEKFGIPSQISEFERDMPEVIAANLHQLVRKYQNAITWMTMGLSDPKHLTRWEKFRVSVLPISAVTKPMNMVASEVAGHAGGNKYGFINYQCMHFTPTGDVDRFHIELRAADGMNSPSALAAIACMFFALVIKAVEISSYGILETGDAEWLTKAEMIKSRLMNNMKGYQDGDRFSDTSDLGRYFGVLEEESLDLVRQLKHILIRIGPAYEVLTKLAVKPAAIRLAEGNSWEAIETELAVKMDEFGQIQQRIKECVDLRYVSSCKDITEWAVNASNVIHETEPIEGVTIADIRTAIKEYVETKIRDGEVIWSESLGTPLIIA